MAIAERIDGELSLAGAGVTSTASGRPVHILCNAK
jgi:hypothetical protein